MIGSVKKPHVTGWPTLWFAASLLTEALAGTGGYANLASAADIEDNATGAFRLSQQSSRSCTENCMSDCRARRTECRDTKTDDETNSCPAQFQICVRRCVVSCSPK